MYSFSQWYRETVSCNMKAMKKSEEDTHVDAVLLCTCMYTCRLDDVKSRLQEASTWFEATRVLAIRRPNLILELLKAKLIYSVCNS